MITVKIEGGLGNQMFQYAAGRMLSVKHTVPLSLDLSAFAVDKSSGIYTGRKFELDQLNIKSTISNEEKVKSTFFRKLKDKISGKQYYYEETLNFDNSVLDLPSNAYLEGYFQSEKYFSVIRDVLLEEFRYPVQERDKEEFLFFSKQIQRTNSVAIHVRRGDFANNEFIQSVHGTCSVEYYDEAIKKLSELFNPASFFLFSDDLDWAVRNIGKSFTVIPVKLETANAHFLEMRLMSQAKANIIANSSFSWWAAWLNSNPEKRVIAPEKWYVDTVKNNQTSDLLPDSWIRL